MRTSALVLAALFLVACDSKPEKKKDKSDSKTETPKETASAKASAAPTATAATPPPPTAGPAATASAAPSASAAAPAAGAGDAMVAVPAGKALGQDLPAFEIDKLEVTVASYGKCVAAGACTAPGKGGFCNDAAKADHPQNCVDYDQAEAYCRWGGKALPTAAQWTYAALGSPPKLHPWGGGQPAIGPASDKFVCGLNQSGNSATTCKAGERPAGASPFGALDMAGNVSEWIRKGASPEYAVYGSCNCSPSGGSDWADIKHGKTVTGRATKASHIGFRCVK